MTTRRLEQALDRIDAKHYLEPLTDLELEALFLWSGYSDPEDLYDYDTD